MEEAFRDRAGHFDGSARSHTYPTSQSTIDRVGAGEIDRGIAWQLRFEEGENRVFWRFGGGWMEGNFATGRWNTTVPPGCAFQLHHNQRATALARAESTGRSRGGFVFRRVKLDFLAFWGGRKEVAFHDRAGHLDGSARSHISPTSQLTIDRVGAGRINQGIAWGLHF